MAKQQWWTLWKTADESFQDCMISIEEKFNRGLEGCSTHFDYITTLYLSKFTFYQQIVRPMFLEETPKMEWMQHI